MTINDNVPLIFRRISPQNRPREAACRITGLAKEYGLENIGEIDEQFLDGFACASEIVMAQLEKEFESGNEGEWIDNGNGSYTCSNCKTEWTTSQIEKMCFCPTYGETKGIQMTIHDLKISPKYFDDVNNDKKRFEIRKDDRDYQVGDLITLREWDNGRYTGREIKNIPIRYILRNASEYGLKNGYCILGL